MRTSLLLLLLSLYRSKVAVADADVVGATLFDQNSIVDVARYDLGKDSTRDDAIYRPDRDYAIDWDYYFWVWK